ncbi:MAG: hypothetical protein HY699_11620, partial [Deltaproteobacteria bacterium]|nr:hypothetical protein [Deltaproteobacteria bacterium]
NRLEDGRAFYGVDTGLASAANAYEVTLAPAPSDPLLAGALVHFKAAKTNTGAATLKLNTLAALSIKKNVNQALEAGDILQNQVVSVIHDGSNFQMVVGAKAALQLNELTDVNLTSPANLDVLQRDASGQFVNRSLAAANIATKSVVDAHLANLSNPHAVTAAQVGAVPTSRQVNTTSPLQGGGALSANLTLSLGVVPVNLGGTGISAYTTGNYIRAAGASTLEQRTPAQVLSDIGAQAVDATLTSLAALGTASDKIAYTTGVDTWAETTLSAFIRTLLDDADAAAARATLGVGAGAGDVLKVGTPVNNQVGVWTGDGTLEGDADFTWDGETLLLNPTHTTSSEKTLRIEPTWNHDSIHRAFSVNPIDTLSDASSRLMELRLASADRFVVMKDGRFVVTQSLTTSGTGGLFNTTFNNNSALEAFRINVTDTLSSDMAALFALRLAGNDVLRVLKDGRTAITTTVSSSTGGQEALLLTQTLSRDGAHGLHMNITSSPPNNVGANIRAAYIAQAHTVNSGSLADGHAAGITLAPTYNADTPTRTVTRHNYLELRDIALGAGAAVTDACVMRFDAAAGTHKAVDGSTTKSSPGSVDAWVKVNINGTLYYLPAYTSKTS